MIPFGISFVVAFRVGSLLGAGQAAAAKLTAEVGTGLGLVSSVLPALGIWLSQSHLIGLFTSDPEVVWIAKDLLTQLAIVVASEL